MTETGSGQGDGRVQVAARRRRAPADRGLAAGRPAATDDERRRPSPWHPPLLAAWSVLAVWAGNISEVPRSDAVALLATTVGIVGGAWVVIALVARAAGLEQPVRRAAIATSLAAGVVLTAGLVADGLVPWFGLAIVGLLVLVALVGAWLLPRAVVAAVTTIANVFTLVAAVIVGVPVVASFFEPATPTAAAGPVTTDGTLDRDVYYIIPDRHPRADTAADVHDIDLTGFQDFLVERGFTIQDRARANYPKTAHSLGATWNLDYVQELIPEPPADGETWLPLFDLLHDHRLGHVLTDAGLDYVHVGNWWGPSEKATTATTVFDPKVSNEFTAVWRTTTALRWIGATEAEDGHESRRSKYDVARAQLAELERLATVPHDTPRLVLAHITVPHEPWVFAPDGSFVDRATETARSRSTNIANQVAFIDSWLERFVDRVVTGNEATDPIVVIQSDEGPHPQEVWDGQEWRDIGLQGRMEKLRTFSAWYLPGVDAEPPEDITGVNTWRFILDQYLDTDFGLLEDRVYVYPVHTNRYEFEEVTDDFG